MSRLVLLLVPLALSPARAAAADWSGNFGWVADAGSNVKVDGPLISIRKGMILANHVLGDMSLRFEFRVPDDKSEARVIVHTLIKSADNFQIFPIGYAVSLGSGATIGQIKTLGSAMREQEYRPVPQLEASSEFHKCEIIAKYHVLQVFIDGQLVSTAAERGQFAGYIGFHAMKGRGVDIRGVQVARLPTYRDPFGYGVRPVGQNGVTTPRLIKQERPFYTVRAMQAKVMGDVLLQAVLDEKGMVTDVKVVKSLLLELDESAIAALRQWRFTPATLDGAPVPVVISVSLSFKLE